MRDKSKLKHIMVQAKISAEAADKLDNIVKEYKFNSRYEVMQYLLSAFIERADCGAEYDGSNKDELELMDIFQRLRSVQDRANTVKPSAYDDIKRVVSVFIYRVTNRRRYVSSWVVQSSRKEQALAEVFRYLYPKLAQRLQVIGRNIGVNGYDNIIKELLEMSPVSSDGIHNDVNTEVSGLMGQNKYGVVPVTTRTKRVENEQGLQLQEDDRLHSVEKDKEKKA
mgnify:CR=1 FL=1